ncbi:hypothetical protein PHJA_002676300 [Phtheirospermum japonicum]|uniref:Uncharacterized protein n=1 Tax=Phtheirospermum japonicum TaxID=374723 RepID=A0A830DGV1_9LAMI|nr:hypothetical protein PHJA_002676300 [Phtheirospermum japonicum]
MAKGSSRMVGQNLFSKDDDNKFISRLLSRERYNSTKQGDSSFRVLYYAGAAGSVPFLWESQPGTPKHTFNNNPPPPLTPPPYYQSSPPANPLLHKKNSKNSKKLNSIFQKNPSKKINNANSPLYSSSSSSSFSSSYSLPSTPVRERKNNNTKARSGSTVQLEGDEDEYVEAGECSPNSTLCFGPRSGSPSRRVKGYYYPIKSVKKVVMSIVGHGTAN